MSIISQLSENNMHLRNYMRLVKEGEFQCVRSINNASHIEVVKYDEKSDHHNPTLYPIIDGKIVYDIFYILPYKVVNPNYCSMLRLMDIKRLRATRP